MEQKTALVTGAAARLGAVGQVPAVDRLQPAASPDSLHVQRFEDDRLPL